MVERLKGKIALVVGAGSIGPGWGNGKATAVAFAREGAKLFCADINLAAAKENAQIIRSAGGEALACRADVSKFADVKAMVAACASAYGRIDVLDNNVGIAEIGGVVEISEADWDRVFCRESQERLSDDEAYNSTGAASGQRLDHQYLLDRFDPLHRCSLCDLLRIEGCTQPTHQNNRGRICE